MAPIIEVSYEVLEFLGKSGKKHNLPPPHGFKKGFTYVPSIKLYVEEEFHLVENWDRAHEARERRDSRMLKIPEFIIFLNHVREFDEKLYKKITQVGKKYPWRIELFDAYFMQQKDGLYVSTENKTNTEKLENVLMEDREISFDSWLEKPTSLGFPRLDIGEPNTKKDNLNYVYPRNNRVAGLEISPKPKRIILDCELNPSTTGAGPPVFVERGCFSLEPEKKPGIEIITPTI